MCACELYEVREMLLFNCSALPDDRKGMVVKRAGPEAQYKNDTSLCRNACLELKMVKN